MFAAVHESGYGALASFRRLERISAYHPFLRFGSEFSMAGVDPERSLIVQWSGRFARDYADHCFTVSKGTQPLSLQARCSLASASMARGRAAPQLDLSQEKRERTRRKREKHQDPENVHIGE
jgi:hypothetical protein